MLLSCGVAVALTLIVSAVMPKRYTAVSRIMIDPPAGNDVRAATAVSPIYLESLKTYEILAASDDMFLEAANHFRLRSGSESIEKLKRSVLKIEIPKNTKVLEISVTLSDPKKAHALANYIADETVQRNRAANQASSAEILAEAEKQLAPAEAKFAAAERDWQKTSIAEPVDALQSQIESDQNRLETMQTDLGDLQLVRTDFESRGNTLSAAEQANFHSVISRMERLRSDIAATQAQIDKASALLAARTVRREEAENRRKDADAALKAVQAHVRDLRAGVGFQGERLRIVDPGIVPERPSSPQILLNVVCAFLAALIAALLYVSFTFAYGSARSAPREYTRTFR
ncbi:MAG TPA: hypothetical protein VG675_21150 [Bryobacteraceae bacterium]|nr:hypothetical protein [Bryobacteraceae bacterium]